MDTTVPAAVLSYFDLSADGFAWRDPRPQQIERRRAAMGDLLLFDILLTSGGIREPDTLYPPVDIASFHRLLEAIHTSTYDALKQDCLVYFLLKWYQDGREDRYKLEKCIPPQFSSLSDAYWNLDAGINIPSAVSTLSDARLNTDYASKILQAISLYPKPMPLVLKYVRTAKPVLTEPDDIDIYTTALAESSLSEAWRFQRTFSEKNETRPRLLQKILDWCFTPTPRRDALIQLLGIALTPYEQNLLQSYATPPSKLPPAGIAALQNLICVRLIQTGKYSDAIKMDRQFSSASSGKLGPQAERTKMVQDLYAALPLAERAILDLELENPVPVTQTPSGGSMSESSSRDWDMSMSWENIQGPAPPAPAAAIPLLPSVPIPVLSAAPKGAQDPPLSASKFGGFDAKSQAATSVFPPLAFNASSSSPRPPPPIIPISNVPKGSLAAQPTVPSGRQPLNASINAFSSLGQSTSRFAPLASGSSANNGGPKSLFDSASRKQNAFYQPPPPPAPAPFLGFNEVSAAEASGDVEMGPGEDAAVESEGGGGRGRGREDEDEAQEPAEDEGLGYSVFGGKPVRSAKRAGGGERGQTRQAPMDAKRVPPGAFVTEDEHEPEPEVAEPPPPPAPARQTRRAAATKASTAKSAAKSTRGTTARTRGRGKAPQEEELSRSLPGSLMDQSEDGSADDAEEEEEGDRLAPLPPRQATVEKVQTRRSSRLSSSSDTESRPEKEKEKAPGRTRTATGAGGRKRRS
ncbi:nuclear pore complex assembly-domain-containing protein [Mycena albidolilacea]|uniref:Nuclear pore complex assembly-domain-containing protein n=1 Tax=Mycena albidolilacea TaxID=1033008 RepID=A0AAD7AIX0_9AGAR|nr:nuclear pore complex assembly-domain-containing protein [Mycena albidolilacea]